MNCDELIAVQCAAAYTSNDFVFSNCTSFLFSNSSHRKYVVSSFDNIYVYYLLSDKTVKLSFRDLGYMWDTYYINKSESTLSLDATTLFDLNNDGIVNAKDYAIIVQHLM